MAKESGPRSRPITVSELIARSETGDSAFPKSSGAEGRTSRRAVGASGMPTHEPDERETDALEPDRTPRRIVGASGMPSHRPPAVEEVREDGQDDRTPDAGGHGSSAVTGIIPIVHADDPAPAADDARRFAPLSADDLVGVDLPIVEHGAAATEDGEHRRVASAADLEAAEEQEHQRELATEDADSDSESAGRTRRSSPLLAWLGLLAELVLGLAAGAVLFWGFTELWKRYIYLALVLGVVVIFAIVTFAHVLRKRDLATTLLALGVGMLVTIGPLVLLAS